MEHGYIVFGCMIWLPLMFWVLNLVGWMIMGDIDVLLGIVGVLVGIGLGIVALSPPVPIVSPIAFGVVIVTMVMYPFVRNVMNRRELRAADVDALEKVYMSLGQRPLNPSARFRLAQNLWVLGLPGHALTIAEESLKQMPANLFQDEHRTVAAWKKHPIRPDQFEDVECLKCGNRNSPGEIYCQQCGAPFHLERLRSRFATGSTGKRVIAAWIAMVAVLVGLPAATSLPPLMTILVILMMFVGVGAVLWLAFRPMVGEAT